MAAFLLVLLLLYQNLSLCLSLNSEGLALLRFRERVVRDPFGALSDWGGGGLDKDPCGWFGVECSDGKVVTLNLKDLCLGGTLAPEIGKLAYMKSIILRNNSFSGKIPNEIGELKELEMLDLGYNNFSGSFPSTFGNNVSLNTLLLDNNEFLGSISPELYELKMLSELQADENQLNNIALRTSCSIGHIFWDNALEDIAYRRQLKGAVTSNPPNARRNKSNRRATTAGSSPPPILSPLSSLSSPSPSPSLNSPSLSPSESPLLSPSSEFSSSPSPLDSHGSSIAESPSNILLPPSASPSVAPTPAKKEPLTVSTPATPPQAIWKSVTSPAPITVQSVQRSSKSKHHIILMWAGIIGGPLFILFSVIAIFFFQRTKVATVKPWATGLSGQLRKAFVSGVPQLKRLELEIACEDFSNIIGFLSGGTLYKGTLSSGVEIGVISSAVTNSKDWSKDLEVQFRKKIDMLSKVNHKNFLNLIGYCEEEEPFTRMMVFEYAPNGTLFEHLHVKEAEPLDWEMRLRVVMGMAYCLEHIHQLTPPVAHGDLKSSSVYLTEDYAAKISEFSFWNNSTAANTATSGSLEISSAGPGTNIYDFGLILLEVITGKIPYSVNDTSLADWALDYLKGNVPLEQIVDPTLTSFRTEDLEKLHEVIKSCTHQNPEERPTMKDITTSLREITSMGPDGATPKLSPLWWAELEIMSADMS